MNNLTFSFNGVELEPWSLPEETFRHPEKPRTEVVTESLTIHLPQEVQTESLSVGDELELYDGDKMVLKEKVISISTP